MKSQHVPKIIVILLFAFQICTAALVTGQINFAGAVNLNTASAATATTVTSWGGASVGSTSGSFAGASAGPVVFAAPWNLNIASPITNFWAVHGWSFKLTTSHVTSRVTIGPGQGSLYGSGMGIISGNGYSPTIMTWGFGIADPPPGSGYYIAFNGGAAAVTQVGGPTANSQNLWLPINGSSQITLTGNDTNGLPLTFVISTNPAHGVLTALNTNTGTVIYTLSNSFVGVDNFAFRVNNGYGDSSNAIVTLHVLTLTDALDGTNLTWSSGGALPWTAETNVVYFGDQAARCGAITNSQESWIETTVTGPGVLSFYWKVSTELSYDFLQFYVNGVLQNAITGDVDWQQISVTVPPGTSTLRWRYVKDYLFWDGQDKAWLDDVVFTQE